MMSLTVDETAGDLPVRDVGLRGLIPVLPDKHYDTRSWKRLPHVLKIKDRQRLFKLPREQLEDLCVHLQEENTLLKKHSRTQELKLRRLSTKLLKHCASAGRDGELEDALQELEARVVTLESQKGVLQRRAVDGDGGARRAAQTAPACCGLSLVDKTIADRSALTEIQQGRVAKLELTAQSFRETLRDKEKEIEGILKNLRRQQADGFRLTIKDNVDVIKLQKQLSDKSAALLVIQEKFTVLQEAYENQLEKGQRSLKESQEALLEKVEELTEQLKQEKQRVLTLEGQVNNATLSLQALGELQERVLDLEGERNLLKKSYYSLLESTLSTQSHQEPHERKRESLREERWREEVQRLKERLQGEMRERRMLEQEKKKLRQENEEVQKEKEWNRDMVMSLTDKHNCLEREVLQHRQEVTTLQEKLDSVTKEFDMSLEDLSETLLQIKVFRMQRETQGVMDFLKTDGRLEDTSRDLQASYAEIVLELQKTRHLLLLQHRLNADFQTEMKTVMDKSDREREENRRKAGEKDKLLKSRALQISNLQDQLKELAYTPRNYKRTIPLQYTWTELEQQSVQPNEEDTVFTHLHGGESILEIHLTGATFTPLGLRLMEQETGNHQVVVTFCTYGFLDFETLSTPLMFGEQPKYCFTSHYALSDFDLEKLTVQGGSITAEVQQALGGMRFMTRGKARISVMSALQHRDEQIKNRANITGAEGEIIGILEFWVRLYPQAEITQPQNKAARRTLRDTKGSEWAYGEAEEIYDYGRGIPNELEVVLEYCVGLSTRWPGLLPDAYFTYRLYDLPPHSTPIVKCCADPVFEDSVIYPLAVTSNVLEYLNVGSLWVYVFDDSESQTSPTYLAKTPIPLQALASGRPIRGDYVLRDPAGSPRGIVRVTLRWKYPFQSPEAPSKGIEKKEPKKECPVQRPTAKPRSQLQHPSDHRPKSAKRQPSMSTRTPARGSTSPLQSPGPKGVKHIQVSEHTLYARTPPTSSAQPLRSVRRKQRNAALPILDKESTKSPHLTPAKSPESERVRDFRPSISEPSIPRSQKSDHSESRVQEFIMNEQGEDKDLEIEDRIQSDIDNLQSDESRDSSGSDVIIIPHPPKPYKKGDRLRVEILSLSFNPSSNVALDQSVHQVYVEYRLLGIPMETTETPMSLRKPTEGEEVHYNFRRVIHVDSIEAAPLRHYLCTVLEGTDPNQGRLKFTVVSEPMNEQGECEDVGYAYLDLRQLLLTGNDVTEQGINVISVDEEKEVVGKLKVSVEAAQAFNVIYQEYHQNKTCDRRALKSSTEDEEEVIKGNYDLHVLDFDDESDFFKKFEFEDTKT